MLKQRWLIVVFLCTLNLYAIGQNASARISIEAGGYVNFVINSLQKYRDGVLYTDWTKINIHYIDTSNLGVELSDWKLECRAMQNFIIGDNGYNLPLNTIEITAKCLNATEHGKIQLSNTDGLLLSGGAQGNRTVLLTYDCGTNSLIPNTLLGKHPDYYFVDIIITLSTD